VDIGSGREDPPVNADALTDRNLRAIAAGRQRHATHTEYRVSNCVETNVSSPK